MIDGATAAVSAITALSKALGGINVAAGALAGLFMTKNSMGFLNYSKDFGFYSGIGNRLRGRQSATEGETSQASGINFRLSAQERMSGNLSAERAEEFARQSQAARSVSATVTGQSSQQQNQHQTQSQQNQPITETQPEVSTQPTQENMAQMQEATENISEQAERQDINVSTPAPTVDEHASSDAINNATQQGAEVQEAAQEGVQQAAEQQTGDAATTPTPTPVVTPATGQEDNGVRQVGEDANQSREALNGVGEAAEGAGKKIGMLSRIGQSVGNIFGQLTSIVTNMGLSMLASFALSKGIEAISNYINRDKIKIENGKKAAQEIDKISQAYDTARDSVKEFNAEEYMSMKDKNDRGALSTEEYEKFAEINNQLAETFPTFLSSYDENGNALLNLGNSADEARQKLADLMEQEKLIASYDLNENLKTQAAGVMTRVGQLTNDIEKRNSIIETYGQLMPIVDDRIGDIANLKPLELSVDNQDQEAIGFARQIYSAYESAILAAGIGAKESTAPEGENIVDENGDIVGVKFKITPDVEFDDLSPEQLTAFTDTLGKQLKEMGISERLSSEYQEALSLKAKDEKELKAEWNSMLPSLLREMEYYDEFDNLSEDIQQKIRDGISNIDVSALSTEDQDSLVKDPRAFVRSKFLDPITDAIYDADTGELNEAQENILNDLFDFDGSDKTNIEYKKYINDQISKLTEEEEAQKQIRIILGVTYEDENGNEQWNRDDQQDKLFEALGGKIVDGQYAVGESDIGKLKLSTLVQSDYDAIEYAKNSMNVDLSEIENWGQLLEVIKKANEEMSKTPPEVKDGTLQGLFNDEDYQKDAEKYSKNLDTLSSSLQTIREEGTLSADSMKDLQEAFPDLTEFTEEALNEKAFENLDSWVDKIRENMEGMSPEGIEQTEKYIRNLIEAYSELNLTQNDVREAFMDTLAPDLIEDDPHYKEQQSAWFARTMSDLKELNGGEDLNMEIIYTLIAQDEFSGEAEDIKAKYDSIEVTWQLKIDMEKASAEIEKEIEKYSSAIDKYQSRNSKKEAAGEYLTPEDYDEIETQQQNTVDARRRHVADIRRRRQEYIDNQRETGTDSREVYQNNLDTFAKEEAKAVADRNNAEAELYNTEKEEAEASVNAIQDRLDTQQLRTAALQSAVDEAKNKTGESPADLVNALKESQLVEATLQRSLSDAWMNLAENPKFEENTDWLKDWIGKAVDAMDAALGSEESAKETNRVPFEQQLATYADQMEVLSDYATEINDQITMGQGKGLKANVKQYRKLRDLSKAQQKILDSQNDTLREQLKGETDITRQRELQSQIRDNDAQKRQLEQDIQGYNDTMKNLWEDNAKALSDAISSALSENQTPTGLTDETISGLITGFSDIGDKVDISSVFYRTADGVKANVNEIERLAKQQNEITKQNFAGEINKQQQAIEQYQNALSSGTEGYTADGLKELQGNLQDTLLEQAQYFATYQEQMKQLSDLNKIALADQSANAGADWDTGLGYIKTAKEMYDKGLVGTDDFKSRAAYINQWGIGDVDTFAKDYEKVKDILTDDQMANAHTFMNNLVEQGLAAQDAAGNYSLLFDSIKEGAAKYKGGIGEEIFGDMLDKMQEFGMPLAVVSSIEEATLKTEDLNTQLADANLKYAELVSEGAPQEALDKQKEIITGLEENIDGINVATDNFVKEQDRNFRKGAANFEKTMNTYKEAFDSTTDETARERYLDAAKDFAKRYGVTDVRDDLTYDKKQFEQWKQETRGTYGSFETPLSHSEFGISSKFARDWSHGISEAQRLFAEGGSDFVGIINDLGQFSSTQLKAIALGNNRYDLGIENGKQAEDALEGFAKAIGYTGKDVSLLVDMLTALGVVAKEDATSVGDYTEQMQRGKDQVQVGLETGQFGEQYKSFELEPELNKMSVSELQSRLSTLGEIKAKITPDSESYDYLQSLEDQTQVTLDVVTKVEEGGFTPEEIADWSDEQIVSEFNITGNAEEVSSQVAAIRQQAEELGQGYDFTIRINNEQFADLLTTLGAEPEITAKYVADTDDLKKAEKEIEDTELVQNVKQAFSTFGHQSSYEETGGGSTGGQVSTTASLDTSQVTGMVGRLQAMSATMKVDADTSQGEQKVDQLQDKAETPATKQVTVNEQEGSTVNLKDKIGGKIKYKAEVEGEDDVKVQDKSGTIKLEAEDNATPKIEEVSQKVEELNSKKAEPKVHVDGTQAVASIGAVSSSLNTLSAQTATPSVDLHTGGILSTISTIKSEINSIPTRRDIFIYTHRSSVENDGTGRALGTAHVTGIAFSGGTAYSMWENYRHLKGAYANGTRQNWALKTDEEALVNELAPDHPESIVRNGYWQIIPGGPHVEKLKRNDIIFNAQQTEDLIKSGKTARAGKIALANGTATSGMPAHAGVWGGSFKFQGGAEQYNPADNSGYNAALYANTNAVTQATKAAQDAGSKLKDFKDWAAKLNDWIPVRREYLQGQIDQYTKQAEYANGATEKNRYLTSAQKTTQDLINTNYTAQNRYQKQLNDIRKRAIKLSDKGTSQKEIDTIIKKIKTGTIDINEYNEAQREFIKTYQEYYDKLVDCKHAQIDLLESVKELEQTKLDNIIDQYDSINAKIEAASSYAEAYSKYNTSIGENANSGKQKGALLTQITQQKKDLDELQKTRKAYNNELGKARKIFGENSNEYRNAQAQLKDFDTKINEANTSINELEKQLKELDLTVLGYVIDKIKAFGDRLSSIQTYNETRGNVKGVDYQTQMMNGYNSQIRNNNDLIAKYFDDIAEREKTVRDMGWKQNSEYYKEYYDAIEQDKQQILNLMNSNENLKKSIETLRWKKFEDLHTVLQNAGTDYDHLRSLIRQGELFDTDDGTEITDRGLANISLLADQLSNAKREIRNYQDGLVALQKEYNAGNISLDEYNTKSREYIGIIQQQVSNVETYKTALSDMYKTQITNENKALQDYINKRKESLQVEKKYHDYQKSISKSKDSINSLRAQINALQGVILLPISIKLLEYP